MNFNSETLQSLVAGRLIKNAEGLMPKAKKAKAEPTTNEQLVPIELGELTKADFIKVEKNLSSLGFFTPSSKTNKDVVAKTINFTKVVDGKKVEASVTITPTALYGLPVTADQDTFLAILKIATEIHKEQGRVTNPISFTTAELLRIQGKNPTSGFHYKELSEQLLRIKSTTIVSKGAVYFAKRRTWATDAFNVFDRVVMLGSELPDGKIADKNYVWFSEWQLENINNNYLLPLNYDTYRKLKNHIAKALVPLLQVWLYASQEDGSFEKRYDELCQILNVTEYKHLSKIKEKLSPALNELKSHGYLAQWKIVATADKKAFKVVFSHGEKYHRDRRKRLGQAEGESVTGNGSKHLLGTKLTEERQSIVKALVERGVLESAAVELVVALPADQTIQDQLEWIDELVKTSEGKIKNKPGFIIHLLKGNVAVPADFITSRKRAQIEMERAQVEASQFRQFKLEEAYQAYCRAEIETYIESQMNSSEREAIMSQTKKQIASKFTYTRDWNEEMWQPLLLGALAKTVRERVALISLEEFARDFKFD